MSELIIELEKINKSYKSKKTTVPALHNIDFQVAKGDMIAIVGPSGSGKSTLLNILGLMDTYDYGKYILQGKDTRMFSTSQKAYARNALIGFVVQDFALIEKYNVYQNTYIPLLYSKHKYSKKECKQKIQKTLDMLGILSKEHTLVHDLSGGERQRVAIARAIINNPDLILADEPTGELDSTTASNTMSIFENLNKLGKTIIIVTHNSQIASRCSKVYTIVDGYIKADINTVK